MRDTEVYRVPCGGKDGGRLGDSSQATSCELVEDTHVEPACLPHWLWRPARPPPPPSCLQARASCWRP